METLASLKEVVHETNQRMQKAEEALKREFQSLRTGRASTALVEGIHVNYYNAMTPLKQLASLSTPEPRQILIQPWDVSQISSVVKAIQEANLGLNPINDGKIIRITIPELTNERRSEVTKVARKYAEESRISIRAARKEANDAIKRLEKDGTAPEDDAKKAHDDVQKTTDKHIKNVDEMLKQKETEINEI
ncbi:MAG: ribosome recycling factor [Candidatus Omnitrophica bacterium]|nr:ribosome recycling factor [Candidatus Omnitrophota bacterium]